MLRLILRKCAHYHRSDGNPMLAASSSRLRARLSLQCLCAGRRSVPGVSS
jgi:hypothetical protein